jgi:hypothetical protein
VLSFLLQAVTNIASASTPAPTANTPLRFRIASLPEWLDGLRTDADKRAWTWRGVEVNER